MTNKKDYQSIIFFGLILSIASFIRLWPILHGSFAFTYDVGRDLLAVRDLVYFHKFSLIGQTSGQGGLFYGPWWHWILVIPFILSSGNPTGVAAVMAVTGILSIIISFWWGSRYENKIHGLFLAGTMGLSSFAIASTTQIWNPNMLIILTFICLVIFSKLNKLNFWQLFVWGIICMLLVEMELVFGVIFMAGLFLALFFWQKKYLFSKKVMPFFLGIATIEFPRIIFEARHNFLQTKIIWQMITISSALKVDRILRLKIFGESWFSIFPKVPILILVILSLIGVLLFAAKVINEKDDEKRRFEFSLTTIIVVFFFATLFYNKDFWTYYLTGLPVIIAFILSFAFSYLFKIISFRAAFSILIVYLFLLSDPAGVVSSFKNPNFVGNAAVYRNQIQVIDYVYQQAANENFNYIAYTPPLIEHTWRYLFWWYGRTKYNYEPKTARQQKFYVIIEPDIGYEGRITAWLRIREGDGKVFKEETFPSGIIVQSRTRPKEIL